VAGRASDTPWVHGWAYSQSHLCGCCRPASGHTVRGVSERGGCCRPASGHTVRGVSERGGCCRPASGHTVRGVSESLRVDQQLTNGSSNRELDKSKVQVLVIAFFIFLSAMSPRFSLVLDPKGRLGGKAERDCEEFDNDGGILG